MASPIFILDGEKYYVTDNQGIPLLIHLETGKSPEEVQRMNTIAKLIAQGSSEDEYETPEETRERVKRVRSKRSMETINAIKREHRNIVDRQKKYIRNKSAEDAEKTSKESKNSLDVTNIQAYPIHDFPIDLEELLYSQMVTKDKEITVRTYAQPSRRLAYMMGKRVIVPGSVPKKVRDVLPYRPEVFVYYDQSGSWSDSDIRRGNELLASIKKMHDEGKITLVVKYFSTDVFDTAADARAGCGTTAGRQIVDHVKRFRPDNVVILTDSDLDESDFDNVITKKYVAGMAFLLFKNDRRSPAVINHIMGSMPPYQKLYNFH